MLPQTMLNSFPHSLNQAFEIISFPSVFIIWFPVPEAVLPGRGWTGRFAAVSGGAEKGSELTRAKLGGLRCPCPELAEQ